MPEGGVVIGNGPDQAEDSFVDPAKAVNDITTLMTAVAIGAIFSNGTAAATRSPRITRVPITGDVVLRPKELIQTMGMGRGVKDFELIILDWIRPLSPLLSVAESSEELRARIIDLGRDQVKVELAKALAKGHSNEKELTGNFEAALSPILRVFAPQTAPKETIPAVKLEAKYQVTLLRTMHHADIPDVPNRFIMNEGFQSRTLPLFCDQNVIQFTFNPAVWLTYFLFKNAEFCAITDTTWSGYFATMFKMLNVTAANQILIEARLKAHIRFIKNIAPRIGADRLSDETLEALFESHTRLWQDLIISMKGLLYGNASCPKDIAQCTIDENCLFTSWMKRHSFMSNQLTILLRPNNKQKNWNGRRSNSNQRSYHSNARQDSYVTDNTVDHDDGEQETVIPESRKNMRSASSSSSGPPPRRPRFQPSRPRR